MASPIQWSAEFVKSAPNPRDLIHDGRPQIAFAGRSNVGKSSLINTLLNRRGLARASSTPGRTQAVNYFLINSAFYFADLPGYGYAKAPLEVVRSWGKLINAYVSGNDALRLMIVILDARRGVTKLDFELIEMLQSEGVTYLPTLTKIDKLKTVQLREQERATRDALGIGDEASLAAFSAVTRKGRDELLATIAAVAGAG